MIFKILSRSHEIRDDYVSFENNKKKNKFTNQYFIFLDQSNATKEDVMSCPICSRIIVLRVITFIEPYEDYVQSKLTSKPHQSRSRTIRAFLNNEI